MRQKFINTPSIPIELDGKTCNSKSREFFPPGTFLLVIDFAENYTFVPQKEIQSEYYHSDQVFMLVHILYRHPEQNVNHIESTSENQHIIKEYHFYISDDRTHDTYFVQHCFGKFLLLLEKLWNKI